MQGLIDTISVTRRITVGERRVWESSPFITGLRCRIDSISPSKILREQYASVTHSAVCNPVADLDQGMRVTVTGSGWAVGRVFMLVGVRPFSSGVPGIHHQELLMTEASI